MSEWRTANLCDIANIRTSNVDKKSLAGEQSVSLCNYMDVYSNDYILRKLEFMTATANAIEIEKFKVAKGDVIITKDSETPDDIGIPAAVTEEIDSLVCGYHLALIKPNLAAVDSVFLSKQLGSPESAGYFSRVAAGSTRYGLSTSAIARTKINFPELPTQQKIARILQTVDRAIEKTEALIEKYQQVKAGLMHDLFTRGLWTQEELDRGDHKGTLAESTAKPGQLRPARQDAPQLYQETPIGWIPKAWGVNGILNLCSEIFLGLTTKVDYVEDGGIPLVRANNINGGKLSFTKALNISEKQHRELTRFRRAKFGDVLISKSGSLGVCALVDDSREFSIYESIIVMQPKPAELESGFLLWLMRGGQTQTRLLGETVGSTVGHLNLLDFRRLIVPDVPIAEQIEIKRPLNAIQTKLDSLEDQLTKFKKQKSGLMHDLLTGKVPVTPDPEEPSDV